MSRGRVTGTFEESLVLPIEPFHEELVDESRKEAYVQIKVDFGLSNHHACESSIYF